MTTKHTHKPNYGRHVDGCPRCTELRDGAEPVRWNRDQTDGYPTAAELRAHNCAAARCGSVCTYGDS